MSTNKKVIVASAISVLTSIMFLAHLGGHKDSESRYKVLNISGYSLANVFDGMPVDTRYPSIKKRLAERASEVRQCDNQQSSIGRLITLLGLGDVVHAQSSCSWDCCPVNGTYPDNVDCSDPNCQAGRWTPSYSSAECGIGDQGVGPGCGNGQSCGGYCVASYCGCDVYCGDDGGDGDDDGGGGCDGGCGGACGGRPCQ